MLKSKSSDQSSPSQDVFIGGDVGLTDLADPANTAALRATGRVGLYMQEGAMEKAATNGTLSGIVAGMAGTGPGEAEVNLQPESLAVAWAETVGQEIFGHVGLAPAEYNVIVNYNDVTWLSDFITTVLVERFYGATSSAPIFSPNGDQYDLTSFATDPEYELIRFAALYGGALTIDAPPGYFYSRGTQYQQFTYQEIQWAHENGLRVTVIISPYNDDAYFQADTEAFVKTLEANGAVPSEWVVENYTPSDPNGIGSDTSPNGIAGAALWVAENAETKQSVTPQPTITPSITLSAPGTVEESRVGGGVTVTESVHAVGLYFPLYVCAMTAGNSVEGAFQSITLDASGNATFTVALENSGDYVLAENDGADPTVLTKSSPVTITEPLATLTLSAPGTAEESAVGAGVTVTETITTKDIAGPLYVCAMTAGNSVESAFQTVQLNSDGSASVSVALEHTGDYVLAETSGFDPAILTKSTPVTIAEPPATLTLSAPSTVAENSVGAGVTVTEIIATTNIVGPLYVCAMTAGNSVESAFQTVPLSSDGLATVAVTLEHSGDYVLAETSGVNPVVLTKSTPVTIAEPRATLTLSAPGTVQESAPGVGVTVTETIKTTNITGPLYVCAMTAGNSVESKFQTVPINSGGTATVSVTLLHSGDYVLAETSGVNPVVLTKSSAVTITDLSSSVSASSLAIAATRNEAVSILGAASKLKASLQATSLTDEASVTHSISRDYVFLGKTTHLSSLMTEQGRATSSSSMLSAVQPHASLMHIHPLTTNSHGI